jgi:hypothetical protein
MDTGQPEQNSRALKPASNDNFKRRIPRDLAAQTAHGGLRVCRIKPFYEKFILSLSFLIIGGVAAAQTARGGVRLTETAAQDMLVRLLTERNIDFFRRDLMSGYGAFGVSIEARFPARDASEDKGLFVLAVPVSSLAPAGGADGLLSWGHELALSFMDRLSSKPPPFETLICFTGDSWPAAAGSGPYAGLNALFDELEGRDDCVLAYCEFPEAPAALTLVREWGASAAPLELAAPFFRLCAETGTPCFFASGVSGAENLVNERGGGVPTLYMCGNEPVWNIKAKTGEKIQADDTAELLYGYAETLMRDVAGLQALDRNYVYLGFNQRGFFIPEFNLVITALFVIPFIVFLYMLLYAVTKSFRKRISISVLAAAVIVTALFLFVTHINGARFLSYHTKKTPPAKIVNAGSLPENHLNAAAESRILLERKIVSISIDVALEPLRYRLFFAGRNASGLTENPAYFIYDAPAPYVIEAGRVEFILGSYPPVHLNLDIALPLALTGEFTIEAFFEGGLNITETFASIQ